MTVEELTSELERCPKNAQVFLLTRDNKIIWIDGVAVSEIRNRKPITIIDNNIEYHESDQIWG